MSLLDSFHDFGLYDDTGFILELPESLPVEFAPWHELAVNVAKKIKTPGGADKLKEEIRNLPKLDSKVITSYEELMLAYLQLGFLAGGYVHGNPDKPEKIMPESIAVPLWDVAERLGMQPSLTYGANMSNWIRIDRNGPYTRDNLRFRYNLLGDFENFLYIQIAIEFSFSNLIPVIKNILEGSKAKDETKVLKALKEIHEWFEGFIVQANSYHADVDPKSFYQDILVLFHGYNADVGLPDGIIFEGVSDKPRTFPTTAASESCIIQVLECLLRLDIEKEKKEYIFFKEFREKRWNPRTRQFYKFLEEWPGDVKEMALTSKSDELRQAYNKIMESIKSFRSTHIRLVTKYFIIPHRHERPREASKDSSSELIPFLKDIRDTVAEHKI